MMFDMEESIRHSLDSISKELGIQMKYRSAMPSGETAHYVQYRPNETVAWTSTGLMDYKTSEELRMELHSWGRLLFCKARSERMRLEKEREANHEV